MPAAAVATSQLVDEVSLTAVRLVVAASSGWAILTLARMLRRPKGHRRITIVPRPIIWLALFWSAVSFVISIGLLLSDANVVTGISRTVYGMALGWTIFGLAWILAIGSRGSQSAVDALERIERIVKHGDD